MVYFRFEFSYPFDRKDKKIIGGAVDKVRGIDEDNLTDDSLKNKMGSMIIRTVARCLSRLICENGDIEDLTILTIEEREGIIRNLPYYALKDIVFAIKEDTYGDSFEAKAGCKNCGKMPVKEFKLSQTVSNPPMLDNTVVYTLPEGYTDKGGVLHNKVRIKEFTAKDNETILNSIGGKKTKILTLSHLKSIHSIEGIDSCDLEEVISNLTRRDRIFLQNLYDLKFPGKKLYIEDSCDCGNSVKYAFTLMDFLFQGD